MKAGETGKLKAKTRSIGFSKGEKDRPSLTS